MKKKILYIDMDGVIADFDHALEIISPGFKNLQSEERQLKVDEILKSNLKTFHNLLPYKDAVPSVNKLFELFEVYFLSTPMWEIPERKIGGQECGIIRCGWTLEHVDTEFKMSISGFRGSLKTKEFLWTVFELYLQEAKFI